MIYHSWVGNDIGGNYDRELMMDAIVWDYSVCCNREAWVYMLGWVLALCKNFKSFTFSYSCAVSIIKQYLNTVVLNFLYALKNWEIFLAAPTNRMASTTGSCRSIYHSPQQFFLSSLVL
jgi:hypothetical protein